MKRFIPTILLVAVCIGAFWYASSQNFFKKEEESASKPLLQVSGDEVTGIRIKTKDSTVELQKKGGKWEMAKPSPLPLDAFSADGWADLFAALTQDGVVEANPSDLAAFGLAAPEQEFEATLSGGTTHTVQVGSPLPIPGHYYVKLKDAPAVYKVSEQQITSLAKTPLDFMQKSPLQLAYNEVTQVAMEWKGQKKTVQKADPAKTASESAWRMDGKELKGSEVEPMLDKLLLMSTDKLVKPASEIKLNAPDLKIDIKSSKDGKEESTALAGKVENEDVWIVKQGDSWAYAIPVERIQEMFDAVKSSS